MASLQEGMENAEVHRMNAGRISRIQVFEAKNMPGRQEAAVRVVRNGGIEGDRHCMDQELSLIHIWQ